MSDEEIQELMNSTMISEDESEYEEDDNDSVADPDYIFCDEITPEDDEMITECMSKMDGSVFVNAVSLSMNLSTLVDESPIPLALPEQTSTSETPESCQPPTEAVPSVSTATPDATRRNWKPRKRSRSPLPSVEATGPQVQPSAGGFTGGSLENIAVVDKNSKEYNSMIWRERSMRLHVNEVAVRGNSALPHAIKKLKTPMEYFDYFLTNQVLDLIVEETNRAARMTDINTAFTVTRVQIRKYLGILIFMSILRYPNLESYWSEFGFRQIPDTMPWKKFAAIKQHLSFTDESSRIRKGEPGYDTLFRIRKVLDHFNERFDSVPKQARLCIDEQMCKTKMAHHLRQYMPNKPHKWGIKLFVLCDTNGYSYRFEVYNGAGDNVVLPGTPNLGATSNVVVRLSQTIPNFVNHILYFDNFYSSIPILVYLRARGIFSVGTIRANRIPKCKLPTDDEVKNKERGYAVEFVGSAYGVEISTVLWKDTKCVRLCSTYVGIQPFQKANAALQPSKVPRFDKKKREYIEVYQPQIIREYNSHMGGVDLMDSYMGRNGLRIKTMDAATRLFYHLLDMAVTNAFILYRRSNAENAAATNNSEEEDEGTKEKDMSLYQFRVKLAQGLCASVEKRPPGRPSSVPQPGPSSGAVGRRAVHPVEDVRYDDVKHFPEWGSKKSCKLCKKSDTHTFCTKCSVHLCFTRTKNCFKDYHVRS